jgi:hypothetical protein
MSYASEIISAKSEAQDAIRSVFMPDGARCFLLKRKGQTKAFDGFFEITTGWNVKWNEYRLQMGFKFATTDAEFADKIAQASHIGFGVPDADDEIDVFAINPDRKDVIPPDGKSSYWKVYADRSAEERYTVI